MIDDIDIDGELQDRELASRELADFTTYTKEDYEMIATQGGVGIHKRIIDKLEAVERGEIKRLMIFIRPRVGKSELTSLRFPTWILGRNPKKKVVVASYGADLASDFGRKAREVVKSQDFNNIFPDFQLSKAKAEGGNWETTKGGGLYTVGVGGALTGKGFDCLEKNSIIQTINGEKKIKNISVSDFILSYNHNSKQNEYKRVIAKRQVKTEKLYNVQISGGSYIKATGEHGLYIIGQGYKKMEDCKEGDFIQSNTSGCGMYKLSQLLQKTSLGNKKSNKIKHEILFLFKKMSLRKNKMISLQDMQGGDGIKAMKNMGKMQTKQSNIKENKLFKLLKRNTTKKSFNKILWNGLQKGISFKKNEGGKQSKLQTLKMKKSLSKVILQDEKKSVKERYSVCSMLKGYKTTCSSQKSKYRGKYYGKSNNCLGGLSHETSSQKRIERIITIEKENYVYDIQVEGNENFYANGILVHNCGIIDDPVKDREEAESAVYQQKVINWYTSTFYTRKQSQDSAIILMMTRWNQRDLAGYLLKEAENGGDKWDVLSIPAIDEQGNEIVWEGKWDKGYIKDEKANVSKRDWAALYQQDPIGSSSNIFERSNMRFFLMSDFEKEGAILKKEDFVCGVYVDPAFSSSKSSDDASVTGFGKHKISNCFYGFEYYADVGAPSRTFRATIAIYDRMEQDGLKPKYICIEDVPINKDQTKFIKDFKAYLREIDRMDILVIVHKPRGKKEDRIKFVLEPVTAINALYLRKDYPDKAVMLKIEDQMMDFPNGKYDDIIDNITMAVTDLQKKKLEDSQKPKGKTFHNKMNGRMSGPGTNRGMVNKMGG